LPRVARVLITEERIKVKRDYVENSFPNNLFVAFVGLLQIPPLLE
jgi:hypothetical protein